MYTFLGFIQSDQADIQKTPWQYKAIRPPDLLPSSVKGQGVGLSKLKPPI
jgi:hypothetical protein